MDLVSDIKILAELCKSGFGLMFSFLRGADDTTTDHLHPAAAQVWAETFWAHLTQIPVTAPTFPTLSLAPLLTQAPELPASCAGRILTYPQLAATALLWRRNYHKDGIGWHSKLKTRKWAGRKWPPSPALGALNSWWQLLGASSRDYNIYSQILSSMIWFYFLTYIEWWRQ